jgi:hypothetical protein
MESSQSAEKSVNNRSSTGAMRPGWDLGTGLAESGKNGSLIYCDVFFPNGLPVALHAGSLHNLLTAADEKIPLPVVDVNNKPQYLVFR